MGAAALREEDGGWCDPSQPFIMPSEVRFPHAVNHVLPHKARNYRNFTCDRFGVTPNRSIAQFRKFICTLRGGIANPNRLA